MYEQILKNQMQVKKDEFIKKIKKNIDRLKYTIRYEKQ